jgi:hypothetical protein
VTHYEFYVLWKGHRWTVEGVDVESMLPAEREMRLAAEMLHDRLGGDPDFEVIGPVYYVGEKREVKYRRR